ncbi:MAG: type II secretion system F family protein [Oscillospiraceae bacterium]|jgi:type IV pilus assembly protein PilC|nr:type II secretion system F family protein [Oscillospiraceae bacterium]
MAKYRFTALDLGNRKVSATVDARDEDDFRKIMRGKSLVPLRYKELDEQRTTYRLKASDVSDFCRQLASMLGSGITAVRALEIIKERDFKNVRLKHVYEKLHRDIQQGFTLSEAMTRQGRAFPELLVNMFASGEASGQLENVTEKMSVHYDKENRLNGKIKSAMTYPIILAVVTVVVVIAIFVFILPKFFAALEGMTLPTLTRVVVAISNFITERWYIIIIVAVSVVALVTYLLRVPKIRHQFDRLKLKLPVIGGLLKIIYTARFARTLSSLYSSGVSMIRALEISGTIVGNKYIEGQFGGVVKDVRNGELLSAAIRKVDGFDSKLSNTVLIGEEAGRLDTMLISTADAFEYESEMATGRLVQLMEPVMLIIMAGVIGTVMMAVMMPMMSMYSTPDLFG